MKKISIPMKGKADSLNTSVAAALIAYEALRQREKLIYARNNRISAA
jgi:tRNA G18 (ribose-2'-O)-methylase SpoU